MWHIPIVDIYSSPLQGKDLLTVAFQTFILDEMFLCTFVGRSAREWELLSQSSWYIGNMYLERFSEIPCKYIGIRFSNVSNG